MGEGAVFSCDLCTFQPKRKTCFVGLFFVFCSTKQGTVLQTLLSAMENATEELEVLKKTASELVHDVDHALVNSALLQDETAALSAKFVDVCDRLGQEEMKLEQVRVIYQTAIWYWSGEVVRERKPFIVRQLAETRVENGKSPYERTIFESPSDAVINGVCPSLASPRETANNPRAFLPILSSDPTPKTVSCLTLAKTGMVEA